LRNFGFDIDSDLCIENSFLYLQPLTYRLFALQAQIRKHVFDAIEEQDGHTHNQIQNERLAAIRQTPASQLLLDLIREYLDFYELDYTSSVFHSEARLVRL
jgi:FGFR1 oncogene partner